MRCSPPAAQGTSTASSLKCSWPAGQASGAGTPATGMSSAAQVHRHRASSMLCSWTACWRGSTTSNASAGEANSSDRLGARASAAPETVPISTPRPSPGCAAQPEPPPCRFFASSDTRPRRSAPLSGTAGGGGPRREWAVPGRCSMQPAGRLHACCAMPTAVWPRGALLTASKQKQCPPARLTDHLDAPALHPGAQAAEADAAAGQHAGLHGGPRQGRAHHLHGRGRARRGQGARVQAN